MSEYTDGWEGFTKKDYDKMYETNTAQWPVWAEVHSGLGFKADETLRANGLHPDKIPEIFKGAYIIGKILKQVGEHIELTYVPTPEE